jgi:HK97 family phage prohead protease
VQSLVRIVVPMQIKAAADPASHTFEGLSAVIGQMDLGNDILEPGAFKRTLAEWKSGTDAMPLLNSHNQYDIMSALGQAIDLKEIKEGLWSQWEVIDGPEGDAVMNRLRPSKTTGRAIVGKMSIGYYPVKWEIEQPEGTTGYYDQIRHLTEVELKEVSLVLFPMAPGAAIDATTVKSFLLSADATDPRMLDLVTKSQLRKLSSRIGNLLKKQDAPPANSGDSDEEVDDDVEALEPNTPPTPPSGAGSETVDPEDSADDTDEDDSDDAADGGASGDVPDEQKSTVYPFQEALQQRLQKLKVHNLVSEINQPKS